MDNICRFPKTEKLSDGLNILNFVCERTADFPDKYLIPANYAINVVISGTGILHTPRGDHVISVLARRGCSNARASPPTLLS